MGEEALDLMQHRSSYPVPQSVQETQESKAAKQTVSLMDIFDAPPETTG